MKKLFTGLACFALSVASCFGLVACEQKEVKATHVSNETQLISAVSKGGDIVLDKDIALSKVVTVSKKVTLDLNGKKVTETMEYNDNADAGPVNIAVVKVLEGGDLTVKGNGSVTSDDMYTFWVAGDNAQSKATLTIKDGSYVGDLTAVQVQFGKAVIKGGDYKVARETSWGSKYLLNLIDANVGNGASIIVKGGSFKGFNPAENVNKDGKFLAEGLTTTENNGVYTVTKATSTQD